MSGGYRDAEIRAVCSLCTEVAIAGCERCQLPFCKRHDPEPELCGECEAEWHLASKPRAGRSQATATIGGMVAGLGLGFAVGGGVGMMLFLGAAYLGIIGSSVLLARSLNYGRDQFLAEGDNHDRLRGLVTKGAKPNLLLPPAPPEHPESGS